MSMRKVWLLMFLTVCIIFTLGVVNPAVVAATVASYIDTSGEKMTFMVDGMPFYYQGVQISPHRFGWNYNWSWANNDFAILFQQAASDGFTVMATPILWEQIETSQDVYDWTSLEKAITHAATYGIKLEMLWFGSDICGSYMNVPPYVKNNYAYVLKSDGAPATDSSGNKKLDKCDPNLLAREKYILTQVMNHADSYQTTHGYGHILVGVQLLNEPTAVTFENGTRPTTRSYSTYAVNKWNNEGWSNEEAFNTDILHDYLCGLAQAVKTSNYSVWTRTNFQDDWENYSALGCVTSNENLRNASGTYLDFLGEDPYSSTLGAIYSYCTDTTRYNKGKNLMLVMENSGAFTNTGQLIFNALAGDANYMIWELNTSMPSWDCGIYATDFTGKTITAKSHTQGIRDFTAMVRKDMYDLATLMAGGNYLKFYNYNFGRRATITQTVNGNAIMYDCGNTGGGIVAARGNEAYVFLSTAAATFKVPLGLPVLSLEKGYFDAGNNWVSQGEVACSQDSSNKYFTINAYECIRLVYAQTGPSPTPTATLTPTITPTATPTVTVTVTPGTTPAPTLTPTATATVSPAPSTPANNLALGKVATGSSGMVGSTLSYLNDASDVTECISINNPTYTQQVTINFNTSTTFNKVVMKCWYCQGRAPSNVTILASANGATNWQTMVAATNLTWNTDSSTVEAQTFNFAAFSGKAVRIQINSANTQPGYFSINEFEVYHQ